eukprot:GHVR01031985.1.p1 GENE.GHVR01031985.1~~GHVR01031985.1.p1  ORF type:complete len:481 (-),score=81.92 GHVR01031985.1:76-1518(-)
MQPEDAPRQSTPTFADSVCVRVYPNENSNKPIPRCEEIRQLPVPRVNVNLDETCHCIVDSHGYSYHNKFIREKENGERWHCRYAAGSHTTHRENKKEEKNTFLKHTKTVWPPSGDKHYPRVGDDQVTYDCFNLKVVYDRDKTGFEESKEFAVKAGAVVAGRYLIQDYLGSAAFSKALQAEDVLTGELVCMKVIRNDKDFLDQSLDEVKLLRYINVNCADVDQKHVLRLLDYFYHKEHLIIVTELLRDNLYEFSKFNRESNDKPYFTLGRLQRISKQILEALEFTHSLRLIHCDLKPENILIKSYSLCQVKVIDFGSSCFEDDHLSAYVQSRSYRAPEVLLGCPYDCKIDIWSFGCIIAELWTGYVLFQNDSVVSLLARIVGIIGRVPYYIMTRGRYVPQYFTQDGLLYQELEDPPCPQRGRKVRLLVPKKTNFTQRLRTTDKVFIDFIAKSLDIDPVQRPSATELLKHEFLTPGRYTDGL